MVLQIFPPSQMSLAKEYYLDNETVVGYTEAMGKVLTKIHPVEAARAKADQLAKDVVAFETRVAAMLPDIDSARDVKVRDSMPLSKSFASQQKC
jgi:hypothetical protein